MTCITQGAGDDFAGIRAEAILALQDDSFNGEAATLVYIPVGSDGEQPYAWHLSKEIDAVRAAAEKAGVKFATFGSGDDALYVNRDAVIGVMSNYAFGQTGTRICFATGKRLPASLTVEESPEEVMRTLNGLGDTSVGLD